tara:strand:+ start:34 stop:810 length:777 start_codon:yes stop_codon:yes gene_type:complete
MADEKMKTEQIGDATLYLGDCLEILPTLGKVDAVVTSPPYNCGKDYGAAGDRRSIFALEQLIKDSCFSGIANRSVVNVGQYIGSRSARILFRDVVYRASNNLPFIDEIIWDKGPANGAAWGNYPTSPRIRAQHESIYAFGDASMPNGNGLSWGEWSRLTTSIWRAAPNVDLSIHPAIMPLEIAKRCCSLWSDVKGVVVDPFLGSGTTGVACAKLGRTFIGIELDERYFQIACKRIQKAYDQPDLFVEPPKKSTQEELL